MNATETVRRTGERLVPDVVSPDDSHEYEQYLHHVERYTFAAGHCTPGRVLDIACGVGYGSRILRDARPDLTLTGVDLSETAIDYARERYASAGVEFLAADAMTFEPDRQVGTIVSLETIEHLPRPLEFIERLSAFLVPGGRFIASVPTTPSTDANPHHLHNFTERSFRRIFERLGYDEIECFRQVQKYNPFTVTSDMHRRVDDNRTNLLTYYKQNPAVLAARITSTLVDGFRNKTMTAVWEKR